MEELLQYATPMSILLVGLLIWYQLRKDFRPILVSMVGGLAEQAKGNPMFWFMICMYFLASALQGLGDEAKTLGWMFIAAICKSIQPGIVAVIALLNKAPDKTQTNEKQ